GGAVGSWTNRTVGLPDRSITSIAVHPTDANTAFVTVSGFGQGHVWKTTNAGAAWTDISGNLADAPVNAMVVDPVNPQLLYIGSDVGVFKSTDAGAVTAAAAGPTWTSLNG